MFDQPHMVYSVSSDPSGSLPDIESQVPGTLLYGYAGRRFRIREPSDYHQAQSFEVVAPLNAAFLAEHFLQWAQCRYHAIPKRGAETIFPWVEEDRDVMERLGESQAKNLVDTGELKSHVVDMLTPYQKVGVGWVFTRPWSLNVWACGSGKTLGAIVSSLQVPGPVLVVCPAKARHVWWSQVQEYTNVEPYRVKPQGDMRKGDETLDQYLERMYREARRPYVIIGLEALADYLPAAQKVLPNVLILDEIHYHGNNRRWKAINNPDGTVSFETRQTKNGNEARAVSVMAVSKLPSLVKRIGLTATPLDDGRPRRLWSQLDLLAPGSFSYSYRRFALRYCGGTMNPYGGLDDKGASHMDELRARCSFMTHEVPYTESHAELPSTRVQVVYLDKGELSGADRWSDEETYGQAVRRLTKLSRADFTQKERLIEARLADACSRKRKYVVDEVCQGVRGGGKVVVFVARRRECEKWTAAVRKALSTGDEQTKVDVWMAHGGVSESERDRIADSFRDHEGPCVLVATGQSIGTGVDGMQTADLAIFAMLPWKPGDFVQWKGRFDRLGGRPTLLKVAVARHTYDEKVVEILVDKFGPIEQFLKADELDGLGDKLMGIEDRDAVISGFLDKLG